MAQTDCWELECHLSERHCLWLAVWCKSMRLPSLRRCLLQADASLLPRADSHLCRGAHLSLGIWDVSIIIASSQMRRVLAGQAPGVPPTLSPSPFCFHSDCLHLPRIPRSIRSACSKGPTSRATPWRSKRMTCPASGSTASVTVWAA